ncbi:hypothetical protein J2R99_001694 [Rhodopseudomonas julia]|uniref:Flavinylation-associated cytochrome domain-containing protein n=1 Tax=Rhodopseudomonas julia TaxID=200617 RepID=A0ABU0C5Q2_9BRAD|nr:DUF4405 domain-containing protein [Rhodopseudomonas julia]MDQ0325845.1 hypothetical protein [Rhodopseudomonas julia]
MAKSVRLRTWATPLTIGSFLLMAATGVLMFFEFDRGLTVVVHQWFSWFFVIGAGGHIVANQRPFLNHLKSRWGEVSVAVFAAVLVASLFSWGMITGPQLERPIERALVDASLSSLAAVTGTETPSLLDKLATHGIAAEAEQSIHDLATQSGVDENRLLGLIFLPD